MKFIINCFFIFILTGCAVSSVSYNSDEDKSKIDKQYFQYDECTYLIGPFNVSKNLIIDDIIKNSIQKANESGLYGDKLVNIKVKEGGYTVLLASKHCIYISGNIIFSDKLEN